MSKLTVADVAVTSIFLTLVHIPSPLMRLWSTHSHAHVVLGMPGALWASICEAPLTCLRAAAISVGCFFIAWNVMWQYTMAVVESPGTVLGGLSDANCERRKGPGSGIWWRMAYERAAVASATSRVNTRGAAQDKKPPAIPASTSESSLNVNSILPVVSPPQTPLDEGFGPVLGDTVHKAPAAAGGAHDAEATYRFCKKCDLVPLATALATLPPELRRIEKQNRLRHQRPADDASAAQPVVADDDDEGEPEIRAWLGEEEAQRLVPPPKPERTHHCKVCRTCVLKYVRFYAHRGR